MSYARTFWRVFKREIHHMASMTIGGVVMVKRPTALMAMAAVMAAAVVTTPTRAANTPPEPAPAESRRGETTPNVRIPAFWSATTPTEKPDLSSVGVVRVLTDDSFPPFNFLDADGRPVGFSVELARAVCDNLGLTCTIQPRRYDLLLDALANGEGDVVIAATPLTPELLARFSATRPYMRLPARFATRKDAALPTPDAAALKGRSVAVVGASAHEAWLRSHMPAARLTSYPDLAAAAAAMSKGETDYVFGDGLGLSLWLGGEASGQCCDFVGGPWLSGHYFGAGTGFVVRRADAMLQKALDHGLKQVWASGRYDELYLRYFPISFY